MNNQKQTMNYILLIVFLLVIYLPNISYFFVKEYITTNNSENRTLASKPELTFKNLTQYPQLWDKYYNDNLPFRKNIINNLSNLYYIIFNKSIDDRVIIGKNENNEPWLFYDYEKDGDEISYINGQIDVDTTELDKSLQIMEEQTNKLKEKNIDIYYIIGPNKSSIYSNYLPKEINVQEDYFLQAYNYLINHGSTNLYYFYELLAETSKNTETYFRTDTHWNYYGSFVYIKELFKQIYNKDILESPIIKNNQGLANGKDLYNFSGLSLPILDNNIEVKYPNSKIKEKSIKKEYGSYTIYENPNYQIDETVFLLGDSFILNSTMHFCSIYKKVIKVQLVNNSGYNEKILDDIKPSKIFYLRVERRMPQALNFKFIK